MSKFDIGVTVMTPSIKSLMNTRPGFSDFVMQSLTRFINGEWGDLSDDDKAVNREYPESAMGSYEFGDGKELWIKRDNDIVTILLPEDY